MLTPPTLPAQIVVARHPHVFARMTTGEVSTERRDFTSQEHPQGGAHGAHPAGSQGSPGWGEHGAQRHVCSPHPRSPYPGSQRGRHPYDSDPTTLWGGGILCGVMSRSTG